MRISRWLPSFDVSWISRDAWLFLVARFLSSVARGSMVVFLAIYLDLQGLSVAQIGLFFTFGLVGATFFASILAVKGDHLGRRRVMVFFSVAAATLGFVLFTIDDAAILLLFSFAGSLAIGGGGGDPIGVLERAALPETCPPEKRTDLFAINSIARSSGSALGALAGAIPAILHGSLGFGEVDSYKPMMLAYGSVMLLSALLYNSLSPRIEIARPPKWVNPVTLPHRGVIFKLSGLFALDNFGHGLVLESLVTLWFHEHYGLELASLAFIWFGWNLITSISYWVAARLAARIGHINTIVFAHIPSNLLLLLLPFAPTAWLAVTLWQVRAFFQLMDSPVRSSYIVAIVPSEERIAMTAYTSISQTGAMSVAPSLAGALWRVGSTSIPFISAGVLRVVYDILLWYMFHDLRTEEEKAKKQAELTDREM